MRTRPALCAAPQQCLVSRCAGTRSRTVPLETAAHAPPPAPARTQRPHVAVCHARRCRRPARCAAGDPHTQPLSASAVAQEVPLLDVKAAAGTQKAPLAAVEAAAEAALRRTLAHRGGSEADRAAAVERALADLRARLAGWPPPVEPASAPSTPAPASPRPPAAALAVPVSADLVPGDSLVLEGRAPSGIGVARLWTLPCGSTLLLRARAVAGDAAAASHGYLVEAVTNLCAAGRVTLHWGLAVPWGATAHAAHGGAVHLDADAGGAWALTPYGGLDAGGGAHGGGTVVRSATARLRPSPGVAGLCFLLQTPAGVLDNGGREFMLPLPCGLMAQLAADATAAGGCVARISLSLGRGGTAGSLLAVVRAAEGSADGADGGVVVELFSDTPHALVLQWGVMDPRPAPGQSPWRAPPPEMRPSSSGLATGGAVQTPFTLFAADVGPPPRPDGDVGGAAEAASGDPPARATLQRACLAFSAEAAERWAGIAFIVLSADGRYIWRDDWSHFVVPWHADTCAVAWDDSTVDSKSVIEE